MSYRDLRGVLPSRPSPLALLVAAICASGAASAQTPSQSNAAAATVEKGQALLQASGRALAQLLSEIDRLPPNTLTDQIG